MITAQARTFVGMFVGLVVGGCVGNGDGLCDGIFVGSSVGGNDNVGTCGRRVESRIGSQRVGGLRDRLDRRGSGRSASNALRDPLDRRGSDRSASTGLRDPLDRPPGIVATPRHADRRWIVADRIAARQPVYGIRWIGRRVSRRRRGTRIVAWKQDAARGSSHEDRTPHRYRRRLPHERTVVDAELEPLVRQPAHERRRDRRTIGGLFIVGQHV